MTLRVGINGFGRIGRNVLRAIVESKRKDIKVVAINNRSSIQVCAHLLKYDSVHGRFPFDVNATENVLTVDSRNINQHKKDKFLRSSLLELLSSLLLIGLS